MTVLNPYQLPASVVSAASPATAPPTTQGGVQLVNVPPWQASTLYPAGFVVQQGGLLYAANTTFTSAGAFVASNWTALTAAGVELSACVSNPTQQTGITAVTDLTGMTLPAFVAPSRPVLVEAWIPIAAITASQAATLYIRDSGNATIATHTRTLVSGAFELLYLRSRQATLTAGTTYNWKVSVSCGGGGGGSLSTEAGATTPMQAQVMQL